MCYSYIHLSIIFEFVAASILLQRWKEAIIVKATNLPAIGSVSVGFFVTNL